MFDERGTARDRRQKERRKIAPLNSTFVLVYVECEGFAVFDRRYKKFFHHLGGPEIFGTKADVLAACRADGEPILVKWAEGIGASDV